jgi:hypothetical protein
MPSLRFAARQPGDILSQLRRAAIALDAGVEDATFTGTPPPPPPRAVDWKQAMGAAVTFAVPVGLICAAIVPVAPLDCLLVMGGAVAGVWLYRRRLASRALPRPVGARIGTILGLMTAAVALGFNAGSMVVARYVLHGGDAMDKLFDSSLAEGSRMAAQWMSSSPDVARQSLQFWLTPDGRAAMTLLGAVLLTVGITLFATIGGAMGARIFSSPGPSVRNS